MHNPQDAWRCDDPTPPFPESPQGATAMTVKHRRCRHPQKGLTTICVKGTLAAKWCGECGALFVNGEWLRPNLHYQKG